MASTDNTAVKPYTERVGTIWRTDDATQVTGLLIPTRNDHSYLVTCRVAATETGDYDEQAGYVRYAFFKNDGGTLSLVGSVATTFTAEVTAGWDVTLDANSTNIRVRITGAAATDITWLIACDVLEVGKSAANAGWING